MKAFKRLDPRTKLVVVACLTIPALLLKDVLWLAALLGFSLAVAVLFQAPLGQLLRKARPLIGLVFVIALLQSVFAREGEAVVEIGRFAPVTTGGLTMAAAFLLRMLIIIVSAGVLSTASSRELIQALIQWKAPYEIAFMATMGIGFIPAFAQEFRDAFLAIQLRGISLRKLRMKQKIELLTGLFQPVVAGAIVRAKALSMAIDMRGFRMYPVRTSRLLLKLKPLDYAVCALAAIGTAATILLYRGTL